METEPSSSDAKLAFNQKMGAIAVVLVIVLLILINRDGRPGKTKSEREYENWLSSTEEKQKSGIIPQTLPVLTLRIYPLDGSTNIKEMKLTPSESQEKAQQVLRVLQLAREAGLFAFETNKPGEREGDIILRVESSERNFTVKFRQSDIEANIKAALFLKLFEEYNKPLTQNVSKSDSRQIAKSQASKEELHNDAQTLMQEIEAAIAATEKGEKNGN